MELNRFNARMTGQEMIEKLQSENKYLRETLVEEKIRSEGNIKALNKALSEVKEDNTKLARQIDDYMDLKEHFANLKQEGVI
jgi:Tfp pilus assembly protein PilO|tara:strand:+ start:615 stop:860 length:246 start_codon:yes stop_codon:yes gene_type:complete